LEPGEEVRFMSTSLSVSSSKIEELFSEQADQDDIDFGTSRQGSVETNKK
jgi:hypothetical protein